MQGCVRILRNAHAPLRLSSKTSTGSTKSTRISKNNYTASNSKYRSSPFHKNKYTAPNSNPSSSRKLPAVPIHKLLPEASHRYIIKASPIANTHAKAA